MQITQVKIFKMDEGSLVAHANFTIDDCFRVRDLRIFRTPTGYYIAMPQVKEKDGQYREVVYPLNPKTRQVLEEAVIAEYEKANQRDEPVS
jgi:stage V sporulation protein G